MQVGLENAYIVLDTVSEGYVRFDREYRCVYANPAAQKLLVAAQDELLGRKLQELSQTAALQELCSRAMTERVELSLEHYFAPSERWYAITAIPDPDGGLVVQFRDVTESRVVEDALRESKERFCKAFDCSPVPMCIFDMDRDASFLEVNGAFERVTGYSRGEILGRTAADLGLYVDPSIRDESRRRLRSEGGYRDLEVRVQKKNGEILTGLVSAEQIEIAGKRCAISVALDVTGQRRAEQELRDSEELHRQIFEVESDALLLVEQGSGRILAANAAASKLYGYSRQELQSMNRMDISAEPAETVMSTTTRKDTFVPLRWHKRKDGTVFPVEISISYFVLKGTHVLVSAIRDISGRRTMEELLDKSEEKFGKAFKSNPAAIMMFDVASKSFIDVNERFVDMTGFSHDEVVGRTWSEIDFWEDAGERDKAVAQLLADGSLRNWDLGFRRKNGEVCRGLLSGELIELAGRLCSIITVMDVTAHYQLESQLRQAQKLESVGRLAGGVAHDFNNLLTIINGYSDFILSASKPGDTVYPYAQEIKRAGEHAAGLTSQLLAFSRKQVIEPRALDVNAIVVEAKRMLQRVIGEDIELTTSLEPGLHKVLADPDQIRQVIMNLVVNARDAMPDGGRLHITTANAELDARAIAGHADAAPGSYVELVVSDTGIGMDEETVQSAFEPFFTTKEVGRGTGLGLPTVYGIVRQNFGWIDVQSEVAHGTSFHIYLPAREVATVPETTGEEKAESRAAGETILIVEDDENVRRLTRSVLETSGYRVLEAASAKEALGIEKKHGADIDLLLTDVILPGMNGRALSDELRRRRPGMRVLFTSGYTADVISRSGVLEQGMAYLPKPFTPESLNVKVREILSDVATPPLGGGAGG